MRKEIRVGRKLMWKRGIVKGNEEEEFEEKLLGIYDEDEREKNTKWKS